MLKATYRDIIVILGLSFFSLAFLMIPALNIYPINLVPQILLLAFLSGYSILAATDPLFNHKKIIKKITYSVIVSLLFTALLYLISTYTPCKIFNYNVLAVLNIILCIIAINGRRTFSKRLKTLGQEDQEEYEARLIEEGVIEDYVEEPVKIKEKKVVKVKTKKEKPVTKELTEKEKPVTKEPIEKEKPVTKEPTEKKDKKRIKQVKDVKIPGKITLYFDIILVVVLTALCALFVLEPTLNKTVVRTVLGLLLVLFIPGYALIASLFPKKDDLDTIERLALSFGLSIAITPLIGLVLNYTPYGIRLDPILVSLTGVTLILCLVTFLRRRRIPEENRFTVDFSGFFKGLTKSFSAEDKTGRILSVVLIISIILAISTTAYIIVKPKEGESFTEFYILGPDGKASNYPTNLTANQEGRLIIGIVNHENNQTSYRLLVKANDTVQLEQTLTLKDGEKLEIPFNFTAGDPGERKMEFLLYKLPDNNNIYRSLHLWLNITGSPT